jgi:hypothetical protein
MDDRLEQKRTRDAGANEPRTSREVVELIRKLRWIGMEGEAERLEVALRHTSGTDCVLAVPRDTD